MPKKRGNSKLGGDKKERERYNHLHPRKGKKGGRTSHHRHKNTGIKCYICASYPCNCK